MLAEFRSFFLSIRNSLASIVGFPASFRFRRVKVKEGLGPRSYRFDQFSLGRTEDMSKQRNITPRCSDRPAATEDDRSDRAGYRGSDRHHVSVYDISLVLGTMPSYDFDSFGCGE